MHSFSDVIIIYQNIGPEPMEPAPIRRKKMTPETILNNFGSTARGKHKPNSVSFSAGIPVLTASRADTISSSDQWAYSTDIKTL